ncbi:fukutin-like [Haliotis rubra]|uniref:fukutin-like n=1 Tax=Haliotis rubra TaxID=36100 RepID=UPI001EE626C6|nr:fukutin-like [Haliotis rubra]
MEQPAAQIASRESKSPALTFDVVLSVVDGLWLQLPHPVEDFLAQMRKAKFIECDYQGAQAYLRCGFIPYTNDMDIEIPIENYSPDIVPAFIEAGFKVNVKGKISDSYQMSIKAGLVRMDVYFVYEEETYWWVGTTNRFTGQKYKLFLPKSDTCWTDFMGYRVRVPCPTLPYITANYGQNWITSVKQWDYKTNGRNIKPNGMVTKEELNNVVHVMT